MKVLVTGANGMLGQDLCPILEDEDFDVIETDIHNLDITNIEAVENVLSQEQPDYVIHCAAYTNVDKAEEDKETTIKFGVKKAPTLLVPNGNSYDVYDNASEIRKYIESNN